MANPQNIPHILDRQDEDRRNTQAENHAYAYRQCLRDVKDMLLSEHWTREEIRGHIDRVLDGDATTLDSGPDTPRFDE